MSQNLDDLEAVRTLVSTLEKFEKKDQERIIRWAKEKLGMPIVEQAAFSSQQSITSTGNTQSGGQQFTHQPPYKPKDLKTFYDEKKPNSVNQFAVLVAYYYKFEASDSEKRESIDSNILQDATRLVNRERLKDPNKTLRNAKSTGYLDNGEERGYYKVNTVGENLVAMTLPQESKHRTSKKN